MEKRLITCDKCGKECGEWYIQIGLSVFRKSGAVYFFTRKQPVSDLPMHDPKDNMIGFRHFCEFSHMTSFYGKK